MVVLATLVEFLLVFASIIDTSNSTADSERKELFISEHQQLSPVPLRISRENSSTCPPWAFYDAASKACQCLHLPGDPIRCAKLVDRDNSLVPYILDCYCATLDDGITEVGQCDYNCARFSRANKVDSVYYQLPPNVSKWNDYMCKEFKRSGTLCGKCDIDCYPRAYSFDFSCIKCEGTVLSNLWKYILLTYLPLTTIYLIIFLLNLDIHSSQLQGFIIFSQFISVPALTRNLLLTVREKPLIFEAVKFISAFYGVWNLDFFRSYSNNICFRIGSLAVLSLDMMTAVYPLLLMLLTYVVVKLYDLNCKPLILLWKPFKILFSRWHKHLSIKTSMLNAFAAFLFLTNAKFFSVSFDTLVPVVVYQLRFSKPMTTTWRLYFDPSIEYFHSEHRWFASGAVCIVFTLVIMPVLILLLYSLSIFQKCLSKFPIRWQIYLHTFVDSFQGCYKDGTLPGTRDCRWYAPTLYIGRLLLMVIYGCTLNAIYFPSGAIVLTVCVIITINADPFKPHMEHLASSMVIFLLFIDASYVSAIGSVMADESSDTLSAFVFYALAAVISIFPIIYISIIVLMWLIKICKCKCHS